MHDAFQNRHFVLNQDLFYRETKKRRRWRDFFIDKRLLSVDVELAKNRLLNIFEIYRMQNRFRASYVRNFIFFDYFDFALKWSDRMIVFAINTFSFVHRYFARWIIMRLNTNWTSSLMSINLVDVIISLTIKALLDSTIINKQFAKYLRVFVQKIVFYQTINLLNVVNLYNQWLQLFFFIDDAFWTNYSCDSQIRMQDFILLFNASNNFLLIARLHVDHAHFMNQYFEDSRHHINWRSNIFHQKIIDNQSILIFFERVINFTFSLKRRFVVITFYFIFSTRCRRSINFLTKNVRKLLFSFCSFILKINVFFFLTFFSCLCWLMLLYNAIIVVVIALISRWAFVFVTTA